jgi:hypothetical protein
MIDRTTKLLLAAIALGLFTNAAVRIVPVTPAQAQISSYDSSNLALIASDVSTIARGPCRNSKIC